MRITRSIPIVAAMAVLAACGASSGERAVPSAPTVAPQTAAPRTTLPTTQPSTTVAPPTSPPETEPPATEPTPTATPTTLPPTSAPVKLPTLTNRGLGTSAFGVAAQEVIADLTTLFGDPLRDSGWVEPNSEFGVCPGVKVRGVRWGDLLTLYTEDTAENGGFQSFFSYVYGDVTIPGRTPNLLTAAGITIGDSVTDLLAAYEDVQIFDDEVFGPEFAIDDGLGGLLNGTDPTSVITAILGGPGCGE